MFLFLYADSYFENWILWVFILKILSLHFILLLPKGKSYILIFYFNIHSEFKNKFYA